MKLSEFLKKSMQKNFFDATFIINFVTSTQSLPLFMSSLLSRLQQIMQRKLVMCDFAVQTSAEIQAHLATSFLGEKLLYGMILNTEPAKIVAATNAYLETYAGVHLVIVCSSSGHALRKRDGIMQVMLDDGIDYAIYCALYKFLRQEDLIDTRFVQELFKRSPTIPLDSGCLLMHYQLFVGKNYQQFFDQWFDRIVEPNYSLFTLSQYFFAKDGKRFYHILGKIADEYPPEFWVAFWSEQLWQAILFLQASQRDGLVAAKKLVSRLPFSFTQKDWKRYSVAALAQAHDMLYQIDHAHKNGAITEGLDLWYAKFLV